ncbi:54S ribosomal protein L12, mitochondrial [Hanseniaspora opuntiae]|jgi:large subunit ribosomal protein L7/L12|uniref:54S ribosomal protein L12, mitochondrial n=1 Tax=Hanseniaspora opuntiae TaxID=211096 RepID=A0A1E5RKT9_9ASCO|nr:54S ribosomal protein L12, mitochondrial [Hanseniaspora opuntiae]
MFATRHLIRRSPLVSRTIISRAQSTTPKTVSPKISAIVDDISKLTLIETSDLITHLKEKLNIPDMAVAPMQMAAAPAAAPAAAEEAEPVEEKTLFNVKLESFDAKSKAKMIKEVKNLLGLSLVDAKKFVESAPKVLKENMPKEDAEKLKTALEALGGKLVLE